MALWENKKMYVRKYSKNINSSQRKIKNCENNRKMKLNKPEYLIMDLRKFF